jgi:hypothetical protein
VLRVAAEMGSSGKNLIVVRRGENELFQGLVDTFSRAPQPSEVIWDRRKRDRRVIIRDDVEQERRRAERRTAPPPTWESHGFVVARSSPANGLDLGSSRSSESEPPAPPSRPGETFRLVAARLGVWGRGLRIDDGHLRAYARQLRQNGRHVPFECSSARLRGLFPGSAV